MIKYPEKWPDLRGRRGVVLQVHDGQEWAQIEFARFHAMTWLRFDELVEW